MKIKLHKPKKGLWNVALVLFIVGLVAPYIPFLGGFGYLFIMASAILLLAATSVV